VDDFDRTSFGDLLGTAPMKKVSFFVASPTVNSCCRLTCKNLSNDPRFCNCSFDIQLKYFVISQAAKEIASLVSKLSNGNYNCDSRYSGSQLTNPQEKLHLFFKDESALLHDKELSSLTFKFELNFELVEDGSMTSVAQVERARGGSYNTSRNNQVDR
jgi:hypothetical protein